MIETLLRHGFSTYEIARLTQAGEKYSLGMQEILANLAVIDKDGTFSIPECPGYREEEDNEILVKKLARLMKDKRVIVSQIFDGKEWAYALKETRQWQCESCEKPVDPGMQFCEECDKYLEKQEKAIEECPTCQAAFGVE